MERGWLGDHFSFFFKEKYVYKFGNIRLLDGGIERRYGERTDST